MKLIRPVLRSSRVSVSILCALGAIGETAGLYLVTLVWQVLTTASDTTTPPPALFAGTCAVILLSQAAASWMLVRFSQSAAARLQYEVCSGIIAAPLATVESVESSRLLRALSSDVNSMTLALTGFPRFCSNCVVVVFCLAWLAMLSVPLAAGVTVMAGMALAPFVLSLQVAQRDLVRAHALQDQVTQHLQSLVHGLRELKGNKNRSLDFIYDVLLPGDTSMRRSLMRGLTIHGFGQSWSRLVFFTGIGLLLFVWPPMANVSVTTLTGAVLTLLYLIRPLSGILEWLPVVQQARVAADHIEHMELSRRPQDAEPRLTSMPEFRSVELRDVTYRYSVADESGFAVGPVNLEIAAGETLCLTGSEGSGKTTLAKLLTGLYAPDAGAVFWNDHLVTNRNRSDYRQLFSAAFAEAHLFDHLPGSDTSHAELQRWIGLWNVDKHVDLKTGRVNSQALSYGQRGRLAFLIACLDDCPVVVFDDGPACRHPEFQDVFYRRVMPELKRRGKAVIVLTNDDHGVAACDRVLKMTHGQLVRCAENRAA